MTIRYRRRVEVLAARDVAMRNAVLAIQNYRFVRRNARLAMPDHRLASLDGPVNVSAHA